jgi:acetyl-CoA carboxylase biotin carboxyl carrier protein
MSKGSTNKESKENVFNEERIRSLIALMKEYDLSEVDLKQDAQQIRLVRGAKQLQAIATPPIATSPAPQSAAVTPPTIADGLNIKLILSPMVGTFYSRPNPKSDDFVKIGSPISADTVVCIVEAMKVFNEIPAEMTGKIVEILVKNEESVDFGRPLFKVDTRG